MKCNYCTAQIEDGSTKCSYCGKEQPQQTVEEQTINQNIDQNNYVPQYNYYPEKVETKKSKGIYKALFISIAICMIACFLPFWGTEGVYINYTYNSGKVADGILLIILGILSFIFLGFKKRIPILICQILSAAVFFYDYMHLKNSILIKYFGNYVDFDYGIGFYLIFIFSIVSVILSLIRMIKKDTIM